MDTIKNVYSDLFQNPMGRISRGDYWLITIFVISSTDGINREIIITLSILIWHTYILSSVNWMFDLLSNSLKYIQYLCIQ